MVVSDCDFLGQRQTKHAPCILSWRVFWMTTFTMLSQVKKLNVVEHEKLNTGFVNSGFDRAMEGREERTGGTSR
jgi:hypothetical protein